MMGCGGMRYFLGVLLVREILFFKKMGDETFVI